MKEVFGFLNVIKPPGMTSHDLVDEARKIFRIRRVGHGGTLDPGASGVLPLALGKATRLFEYLEEATKVYRGEITFGISTSTHDAQGKLLEQKGASRLTLPQIEEAIQRFVGEIRQIPPQVSAVRHQGRRSYEWERKGVEVPLEPRAVRIDSIAVKAFYPDEYPRIMVDVQSSPGMYMRSLARDLGKILDTGAYLSFLVRLESKPFRLEEALTIEDVKQKVAMGETESILIQPDKALPHIPKLSISEQQKILLLRGNRLPLDASWGDRLIQLYDEDEELVALGKVEGDRKPYFFHPVKIFD